MSGKTRSFLLSLTIIAVILFSAFGTTSVYADGGTTSDPPPTETTSGSEEAGAEATEPATEEAAEATTAPEETTVEAIATEAPAEPTAEATEAPVEATSTEGSTEATAEETATPEPVATEASSTEEAAAPQPTEESAPIVEAATPVAETTVLDAVPENTTVTIVDANGQTQPLATQAAADAVVTSDPMWCPAGVAPGGSGCTPSFTSFTALLTELNANPTLYQGTGTIYVQQGAYQGGESSIDFNSPSYDLSNIRNADLNVIGGWNTTTGLIDSATPSTFNNIPILIGSSTSPWGGSLTLSNLSLSFSNNSTSGTGLTLYTQNNITLLNVNVTNAPADGADLNAGGNVNVINSKFERNQNAGAVVKSGGSVNVFGSSLSNPANARRQDIGLDIQSTGPVTLVNVLTNENRLIGTNINSGGAVTVNDSIFSGTKHIEGTNFLGYGLQVVTPTSINLIGVTANDNFLWGASLQGGGDIAISDSMFNANTTASPGFIDDTGLFINGGGAVDLTNVTANDNRLYGAKIDAVGGVAIHNSTFSNNRGVITTGGTTTYNGHGLQINSLAGITLEGVTATNNMLFGAQLNAGGEVGIAFSTFSDTSTGSSGNAVGQGLEVITTGNVSMSDVVLNNNQTVGAHIQAGGDVTLTDVTATNNGTDGIILQGVCTIVSGGTFSSNGGYGLNLGSSALGLDPLSPTTFANNSAGDTFPANPALCALLLSGGNPTTPTGSATVSGVFSSLQTASQENASIPVTGASAAGSTAVTLKNIVSKVANGKLSFGVFTGQYTYAYSNAGLQIYVLAPSSDEAAVRGTFRAY